MGLWDSFYRTVSPQNYQASLQAKEMERELMAKRENEQVQLLGNPYRARLLLGDTQMQNQPTPNYMGVGAEMRARGIEPPPGLMQQPAAAPRPGLGSIGQDRNLMAMGADPLAVVQDRQARMRPDYVGLAGIGLIDKNAPGGPKTVISMPTQAEGPLSPEGKIEADFKAGRITQATRDALLKKATDMGDKSASTKFAFDRKLGKTRAVTESEIASDPTNFAPPEEGQQAKPPQKYSDQVAALNQMDGALSDYEKLLGEVGTEFWNADKAAALDSLQTQLKFGLKGIEQTGALDRGSVEVMNGMIPDATGFLANVDIVNGAKRAKAKLSEMKKYTQRARSSLDIGFKGGGNQPPGTSGASIDDLVAKYRSR